MPQSKVSSAGFQKIIDHFNMPDAQLVSVQKGYRNQSHLLRLPDGTQQNLIIFKSEPGALTHIANAHAVGRFLASQGLPVRHATDPRILVIKNRQGAVRHAAVHNYLPGNTIPWEAYTKDHIKALGGAMGDIHRALQPFAAHLLPDAAQQNMQLSKRMERYFSDRGVQQSMRKKLGVTSVDTQFKTLHMQCAALPNQQALHLDFVRGNILFIGTQVSGIIDLEKTARGHRLLDIARTLSFLLVDCKYKPEHKIRKYFLFSGYKKRGRQPLSQTHDFDLLEKLVDFYLVYDFYKFLRHNPYESLLANEHFMRTKDLLLKRGLAR
ncbi:MAG TPA: phosphotransferase [Candidatus Saccharimonadales bacterium]|nr:phosphotransferase [Candidatus Saccharimonadales bacterium]